MKFLWISLLIGLSCAHESTVEEVDYSKFDRYEVVVHIKFNSAPLEGIAQIEKDLRVKFPNACEMTFTVNPSTVPDWRTVYFEYPTGDSAFNFKRLYEGHNEWGFKVDTSYFYGNE